MKTIDVTKQDCCVIKTQHPKPDIAAGIYDKEEREAINELIRAGFLPHHTSVGIGKLDGEKWKVQEYEGMFGRGYKLITRSPYSHNFNHLTYFLQA